MEGPQHFARAMRTRHSPSGVCSPRVPAIYTRAPEWDVSATAEAKYDPFGEPSRKGTRKPWPNFCQAFRVLLRERRSARQIFVEPLL